jgi:hypothetical protein
MSKYYPDQNALLADEILKILSKGLTLSSDVIHYIDSTFSHPTIKELEDILADDSNCEKDSLMELLFFPGESMQVELENILESCHLKKEDEGEVLKYLCQNPLRVSFQYPKKRGSFSLEIPEPTVFQFVKRLKISKQIDRNLLSSIKKNISENYGTRCAVKIRNSRFKATDKALWFLCAYFEKWNTQTHDVFKHTDFVLRFLEEFHEDDDIFEALMKKKRFYLKHLKRTEKFEEQLLKTNIETLMLKGKISAHMDKNEARENIAIIDRISQTVFGKTEHYETLFDPQENIEFHSAEDIKKSIKKLL